MGKKAAAWHHIWKSILINQGKAEEKLTPFGVNIKCLEFTPGCPEMLIKAVQEGKKQGRPETRPCFCCVCFSVALYIIVCLCLHAYVLLIFSNTSIVPSKMNFHTHM